ncbi:hypothetical protein CORC01_11803 [Colletotrichum orchidophilum]|uniref:Endonuclease/exonuclease/phosphatase domain-containing protein n=1 Tax=Colletotrichum orchidophilum TaxID=1209926 RepID=A0A1G4AV16_9PEZI|nr:uncharacterized protein CORC01_11803 [Colletotrichum orchidophilum]OHE92936.1 hypothetical protein CORC01_11803 [Colletotrichum orchidophilum]
MGIARDNASISGSRISRLRGGGQQTGQLHTLENNPAEDDLDVAQVPETNRSTNSLDFLQANVMRCWDRVYALHQYSKTLEKPAAFMALQDPPLNIQGLRLSSYWLEIKNDWPTVDGEDRPVLDEDEKQILSARRFAFYVHKSIPKSSWKVEWAEDRNRYYVAYPHLDLEGGETACIGNAYNRHRDKTIDFDILLQPSLTGPSSMLLGDFNIQHPKHGGSKARKDRLGTVLWEKIAAANMTCLPHRGTPTISNVEYNNSVSCGHEVLSQTMPSLHTTLSTAVDQDARKRFRLKKSAAEELPVKVKERLEANICPVSDIPSQELDGPGAVDQFAKAFTDSMKQAIEACADPVDLIPAGQKPEPETRLINSLLKLEERELGVLRRLKYGTPVYNKQLSQWQRAVRNTNYRLRIYRTVRKRNRLAKTAEHQVGLYELARQTRAASQTQGRAHMPWLKNANGSVCNSHAENAHCFRSHIWSETSDDAPAPAGLEALEDAIKQFTTPAPSSSRSSSRRVTPNHSQNRPPPPSSETLSTPRDTMNGNEPLVPRPSSSSEPSPSESCPPLHQSPDSHTRSLCNNSTIVADAQQLDVLASAMPPVPKFGTRPRSCDGTRNGSHPLGTRFPRPGPRRRSHIPSQRETHRHGRRQDELRGVSCPPDEPSRSQSEQEASYQGTSHTGTRAGSCPPGLHSTTRHADTTTREHANSEHGSASTAGVASGASTDSHGARWGSDRLRRDALANEKLPYTTKENIFRIIDEFLPHGKQPGPD